MGRVTGLLVGALLVLALGGCGADGSASDPPEGTTQTAASVRERFAAGLAANAPSTAAAVEAEGTTLTPVDAGWLHGWQVFDVQTHWENDPVRFFAALSDDDTVLMLSGEPDSFSEMARRAQVVVDDASLAVDVGNIYLDVTRDFVRYSYRIDSLSDVQWVSNADTVQRRAELEAQYAELVQPPVAVPSDTGWNVTVWMVYDRSLVRHDLQIATDGAVQDSPEVVETEIPVPWTF